MVPPEREGSIVMSNPNSYSRARGQLHQSQPQPLSQSQAQSQNNASQPSQSHSQSHTQPQPQTARPDYHTDYHQSRQRPPASIDGQPHTLLPRPPQGGFPRDDHGHEHRTQHGKLDAEDDHDAEYAEAQSRQDGDDGHGGSGPGGTASGVGASKPVTACFNCRALRQKCDRKMPCSRCTLRHRPCRYPSGSNRGRKHGNSFLHNTNSATVDRLLSRIGETAERDQVVAALLNFAGATQHTHQEVARHRVQQHLEQPGPPAPSGSSHSHSSPRSNVYDNAANPHNQHPHHTEHIKSMNTSSGGGTPTVVNAAENEFLASLVSPLHIMAAAITADTAPYHRSQNSPMSSSFLAKANNKNLIDDRLSRYFATQTTHQKDWQVLATQPIDSPLKLEVSTCDPVAARLIDQDDVDWYFKLFFKYRSPLIGLLDPLLHTPEYVHDTSFVLFSALCSLGCAVSDRPRDRVVYPALLSLAEGNMKWAIAVCVKSLEVVQSIIVMQYWAPACARQSDDPYWLRLSHAVQLARELGIHRPATIAEQVNARARGTSPEFKERLFRNFERTWLYTFISDKSFGIITGRSMGVAWKEIPPSASEWWRKPQTGPVDRIVSGIVEFRGYFLNAMEQRKRVDNTLQAIEEWHGHTYRILDQARNNRCGPQNNVPQSPVSATADSPQQPPGSYYLPVLAFYMDHSIMVLNAQALRDMIAIDQTGSSPELLHLSALNVDIASRLLDTMLHDEILLELQVGYHNNQFIMVCHAATEILYAIQRGGLSLIKVDQAAAKVRAIPGHLERIAARLPSTSPAHLYASLSGFFVCQLDKVVRNNAERYGAAMANSTANTDDRSTAGSEASNNNSAANINDNAGANNPEGDIIGAGMGEPGGVVHQQQQASSSSSRAQLDRVIEPDQDSLLADWWKTVDGGLLDSTTWMDMGFLSSEQPILGSNNGGDPDIPGSYQMF